MYICQIIVIVVWLFYHWDEIILNSFGTMYLLKDLKVQTTSMLWKILKSKITYNIQDTSGYGWSHDQWNVVVQGCYEIE